jgi:hypothetical protein
MAYFNIITNFFVSVWYIYNWDKLNDWRNRRLCILNNYHNCGLMLTHIRTLYLIYKYLFMSILFYVRRQAGNKENIAIYIIARSSPECSMWESFVNTQFIDNNTAHSKAHFDVFCCLLWRWTYAIDFIYIDSCIAICISRYTDGASYR